MPSEEEIIYLIEELRKKGLTDRQIYDVLMQAGVDASDILFSHRGELNTDKEVFSEISESRSKGKIFLVMLFVFLIGGSVVFGVVYYYDFDITSLLAEPNYVSLQPIYFDSEVCKKYLQSGNMHVERYCVMLQTMSEETKNQLAKQTLNVNNKKEKERYVEHLNKYLDGQINSVYEMIASLSHLFTAAAFVKENDIVYRDLYSRCGISSLALMYPLGNDGSFMNVADRNVLLMMSTLKALDVLKQLLSCYGENLENQYVIIYDNESARVLQLKEMDENDKKFYRGVTSKEELDVFFELIGEYERRINTSLNNYLKAFEISSLDAIERMLSSKYDSLKECVIYLDNFSISDNSLFVIFYYDMKCTNFVKDVALPMRVFVNNIPYSPLCEINEEQDRGYIYCELQDLPLSKSGSYHELRVKGNSAIDKKIYFKY